MNNKIANCFFLLCLLLFLTDCGEDKLLDITLKVEKAPLKLNYQDLLYLKISFCEATQEVEFPADSESLETKFECKRGEQSLSYEYLVLVNGQKLTLANVTDHKIKLDRSGIVKAAGNLKYSFDYDNDGSTNIEELKASTPLDLSGILIVKENCDEVWCTIPEGTFNMGSHSGDESEKPVHTVKLSSYSIMKYEATAEEFEKCVQKKDCSYSGETTGTEYTFRNKSKKDHPVNFVTFLDATNFCKYMKGSVPTEAQWEYAARGNDGRTYPWGNFKPGKKQKGLSNCDFSSCIDNFDTTAPVGSHENGKSPFGVYDMHGNVWEWTRDLWNPDYYKNKEATNKDPVEEERVSDFLAARNVVRGGGFSVGAEVTAFTRYSFLPEIKNRSLGIRCIKEDDKK